MSPAFWFTVEAGGHRFRMPLPLLLPLALVVDVVALVALSLVGGRLRQPVLRRLATAFVLSRLTVALLLHAGRLQVRVRDGTQRVSVHGGWT